MSINLSIDLTSLAFWGGVPSAVFLFRYALQVWFRKAPSTGLASFCMWTVLDVLLLVNTFRTGKPIWLPLGWVLGAASVSLALLARGKWQWTRNETVDAIAAAIAAIVSITCSGVVSLVASVIAMTTAGIPILVENWKQPVRQTFPLWFVTVISCVITLLGSDWSFAGTFLPWCSLAYNGLMSIVVLRKPTRVAIIATA